MSLCSNDPMEWEPDYAPIIFHCSNQPFSRSPKRNFDTMSDRTEPLGRDSSNLLPFTSQHRDPHGTVYPGEGAGAAEHVQQPMGRWHWLSYYVHLVFSSTRDSFDRAYQGAKRRLRPAFPSRSTVRTLRTLSNTSNRQRRGLRNSAIFSNDLAFARRNGPGPTETVEPLPTPAHQESDLHSDSIRLHPHHIPAMPGTYPAGHPDQFPDTSTSMNIDPILANTAHGINAHSPLHNHNIQTSLGQETGPNPLLEELETIQADGSDTPKPVQKVVSARQQDTALMGSKHENNAVSVDNHTPARSRKNVTFVASPRTGRPVTRTKKYVIGESIDFPSPTSSKDESSFMNGGLMIHSMQRHSPDDSRAAVQQLQRELYSASSMAKIDQPILSDQGAPRSDKSANPSSAGNHSMAVNVNSPIADILPEYHNSPNAQTLETNGASISSSSGASSISRLSSESLRNSFENSTEDDNTQDGDDLATVLKQDGEDDVFVQGQEPAGSEGVLRVRKRQSASSLSKGFGALDLSSKPDSLVTSTRRLSTRQASLEAKRKEEEAKARAELAKRQAEEEEERRRRLKELTIQKGLPRIPTNKVIPPLSKGARHTVGEALAKGMQTQVALAVNGNPISRRDIGKVLPTAAGDDMSGWLNDEVISAYLQLIVEYGHQKAQHKRTATPRYHAFNTYFYTNLQKKGYDGVKRWAKKAKIGGKDLLNVDMVFVPVNVHGNHWTMATVQPKHRRIQYFDSLHYGNTAGQIYRNIKIWLKGELGSAFIDDEWEIREQEGFESKGGGPTQRNGSDCGVFAITTAKMLMLGADPMAVSYKDIPLQRQRIVAEVLNGGFSGEFEPHVEFD